MRQNKALCTMEKRMDRKLKCKCGHESFFIIIKHSCKHCQHNGVYVDKDYIFPEKTDEERTMCNDDRECEIGSNFNGGCYMFICCKCEKLHENLPLMYD